MQIDPKKLGRLVTRPLCRLCLDWSERRPHLARRLGAAICRHGLETGWLRRIDGTRAITVTDGVDSDGQTVRHRRAPVTVRALPPLRATALRFECRAGPASSFLAFARPANPINIHD